MRRFVSMLPAALVAFGPVAAPAHAAAPACPAGVAETTGTNPAYADVAAYVDAAADAFKVPPQVLKAIAYREGYDIQSGRRWAQFHADGTLVVTGVCDVGVMQVDATRPDVDAARLASSVAYNVQQGARILAEKWEQNQENDGIAGTDDRYLVENWYYAVCAYNGCTGESTEYTDAVTAAVEDPFRHLALARSWAPPLGYTRPQEAAPGYTFPGGFRALREPGRFEFYDASGSLTATVAAPVHDWRSVPPVSYGHVSTLGPDVDGVSCLVPGVVSCAWWRLADGAGVAGRAHWTNAVSDPSSKVAVAYAARAWDGAGNYRVEAYVPALPDDPAETGGTNPLGVASYTFSRGGATVTVDQSRAGWATLGTGYVAPGDTVTLTDHGTPGTRVVADALRFLRVPAVTLAVSPAVARHDQPVKVYGTVRRAGGAAMGGHLVYLYRRPRGAAAWTPVASRRTDASGNYAVPFTQSAHTEYKAVYKPTPGWAGAESPVRLVTVVQTVTASLSAGSVPLGATAYVSASVAPAHPGYPVNLQRYVGGAWRDVTVYRLSSASTVRFPVRPGARGTHYYRVYRPADPHHGGGASVTLTLRVY